MRAVLFDCDGTLADSFATIIATMTAAFRHCGQVPPHEDAIREIIGLSLEQAAARLAPALSAPAHVELADAYRHCYRNARRTGLAEDRLFPGMDGLVRDLAAREEVLVGIVTGKSRRGVDSLLRATGLGSTFMAIRTADDCPSKPDPAMVLECCAECGLSADEAVVVGDAVHDMAMAKAAGAAALGVSWGAGERKALEAAGAFAVADDAGELARRIDAWLGSGGESPVNADLDPQLSERRGLPAFDDADMPRR